MLTQYDINMMENTVMDILRSWGTTANIFIPKPEKEQPNFNPLMREYIGDIIYDILIGVPVERLEVVNEYHNDRNQTKAGTRNESSVLYKFPIIFNNEPLAITPNMIFTFGNDNEKYHINTIRNRIGETIVDVDLIVGGTDSGVKVDPTNSVIGYIMLGSAIL